MNCDRENMSTALSPLKDHKALHRGSGKLFPCGAAVERDHSTRF